MGESVSADCRRSYKARIVINLSVIWKINRAEIQAVCKGVFVYAVDSMRQVHFFEVVATFEGIPTRKESVRQPVLLLSFQDRFYLKSVVDET